jgi:3-phosphoshikimate 1-carboxyvinyltransferase
VSATDEYPILFVIAALTQGTSVFKGIEGLANKESNRIEEMKKILNQIGIKCKSTKKEMKVFGCTKIKKKNAVIKVPNLGDHRICMSTVILSLVTGIKSEIKGFETVRTSSPSFLQIIKSLGGSFEIKKTS